MTQPTDAPTSSRTHASHPADLPQGTLVDLFLNAVALDRPRAQLRRTEAGWQPISHAELLRNVRSIGAALRALGIGRCGRDRGRLGASLRLWLEGVGFTVLERPDLVPVHDAPDEATPTPRGTRAMDTATWIRDELRDFSLTLPEAYADFPWGERVTKVNKKIFLFLSIDGDAETRTIGVKLAESHAHALSLPGAAPSGYGLGRAGWVTIPLDDEAPPAEVLREWVEESYRLVAPKRLVAQLDQRRAGIG